MLRQAVLGFISCTITHASLVAAEEPVPAIMQHLSSGSVEERREAARQFLPARIVKLEPRVAVRAALKAANDSDAWVRESAMGGLGLMTALHLGGAETDPDSSITRAIHEAKNLRPTLERIVRGDPVFKVVIAATVPLMSAYGSDPTVEELVLDRADRLSSPIERMQLMENLMIGGIDSERTFERLTRYLDGAPTLVQYEAARLLVLSKHLPRDRLDDFLRLLETPETFARPELIEALPRFNLPASIYLERLVAIRVRLDEELAKPREQRTVTIYNDADWKQTLDKAIVAAEKDVRPRQP